MVKYSYGIANLVNLLILVRAGWNGTKCILITLFIF
jgi:hypothetical protein